MGKEDGHPTTPVNPESTPSPNLKDPSPIFSQNSSSHHPSNHNVNNNNVSTPPATNPSSPEDFILSVASNIASQPLQSFNPDVWGVLTAISSKARKRHQGINMLLTSDEHYIGRLVEDTRFQIASSAISARHCKISRERLPTEGVECPNIYPAVFLKDTSTNGTYLNWTKLNKTSSGTQLQHGDIVSFSAPPQHELAFAFVFREVHECPSSADGALLKRKAADSGLESKRLKGIGIGAPEGPVSLDDFRSLQRSNTELRQQLENQVITIDTLRSEKRAVLERHEIESKDLKESISKSYIEQLEELQQLVDLKQKELVEVNKICAEQKHATEDLTERLGASRQSCADANEIINSQKVSISELKEQVDEEREQRRVEREKAAIDLKSSIQRVQAEAQDELRRLSEAALIREKEQQEMVNKLQESEKERCLLVETLRSKLEETRHKLVGSDYKVRQLEANIRQEQLVSANRKKRTEELEHETRKLRKDLDSEKAAREEAWTKVSALELEINAAMRDLEFEKRRLKAARERIMLRETQLRAFYSTTEAIKVLFVKQQEQLKAMQRTLEDEDNYENGSIDINLNPNNVVNDSPAKEKESGQTSKDTAKEGSSIRACRHDRDQAQESSEEVSVTEKHNCDTMNQENGQDTQEMEITSTDQLKGGFGSDIDGAGTTPVLDGDPVCTERILETESPGMDCERNIDLNKCNMLAGYTLQLDDENHGQEPEQVQMTAVEGSHQFQSNDAPQIQATLEDTQGGDTIKTADLLASEVAGSWACSTAPSVHGENDSPSGDNVEDGTAVLTDSCAVVANSEHAPSLAITAERKEECRALSKMISIVAPDMKEHFGGLYGSDYEQEEDEKSIASNSDTEDCAEKDAGNGVDAGDIYDSDTEGISNVNECRGSDGAIAMDEDDEATQDDADG